MWVRHLIQSLQENKMSQAHSFMKISHKISGSLSDLRVTYFTFGTPYYIILLSTYDYKTPIIVSGV